MSYRATILLVDDEPEVLLELAELLEMEGFCCLTATSAADALSLLRAHPDVGLVITDLRMPEESGLRLIQDLRTSADRPNIPIIVTSGHADMDDIVIALRLQVLDFLRKPIYYEHLIERLGNLFPHAQQS